MSELAQVFETLQAMTLLQLLLAFVACFGFALGQGALLGGRPRRWAWSLALLGAVGFAFMSPDWTRAAVLVGFAVAGMGVFTAAVWLLGLALAGSARHGTAPIAVDPPAGEGAAPSPPSPAAATARSAARSAPAHST